MRAYDPRQTSSSPSPRPAPPAGAPRLRDAARSRTSILDAAERILAHEAWRDATLARIGAEAGVSRGTPGYFFHSKAGLLSAVEERLAADAEAAVADGPGDVIARATALVIRQLEFAARRPALARLAADGWADASSDPRGAVASLERLLIQRLSDLLESAPGADGLDCASLAAWLVTTTWIAGLPQAPGESRTSGSARHANHRALVTSMLPRLFVDNGMAADGKVRRKSDSPDPVTDLSASKSRPWRLPGVS